MMGDSVIITEDGASGVCEACFQTKSNCNLGIDFQKRI